MKNKPAIEGGTPVRSKLLPYARHWIGQEEIDEVVDTLKSDWITTGPKIDAYEKKMAGYLGCKHVIATNSCTAALHLCLAAHNIGSSDEVILPDLTFAATPSVVSMLHGQPRLVDVREGTYDIDINDARKKITPKTKAIMPVHYAGQPCDMDEIRELAEKHGLIVIEDAAHAIGAEYKGRKIGASGTVCFSFHPIKNMTMGEGGIVALNDDDLNDKIRLLRLHGLKDYKMVALGYKYTINDMQASLGLRQLDRLEGFITRRNEIAKMYADLLGEVPEINLPVIKNDVRHAFHLFVVTLALDRLSVDRNQIRLALRAENIHTQIHFVPIHHHPYYAGLGTDGEFPIATKLYQTMLSIPMFPSMSNSDVDDVVTAVKKVIDHYKK